MNNLYLLQSIMQFKIQSNPSDTAGFLIAFVVLAALIIFLNVSRKIRNSAVFRGEGVVIPKKPHIHIDKDFYQKVKFIGLDKRETAFLEKILEESDEDPFTVLQNSAKTDECFKQMHDNIIREKHGEDAIPELMDLFSIRNAVEYFYANEAKPYSKNVIRNYRRRNINCVIIFYLVITIKQRSKFTTQKKLVVEDDCKYLGNMMNISQGGCAISMKQYVKAGQMIKIEFTINMNKITALAQILRLNKNVDNWIYHIKFLRLSKKSLVALNEYIFEY
ncbi:MAG: PilZ domain-containing protein [Spirochaetaceae bacterium]|jgi:hypothetical protein|nr:PilZ domain-containing protein [Spirochaetaceae bacterium]